jgi:hypothetical protein
MIALSLLLVLLSSLCAALTRHCDDVGNTTVPTEVCSTADCNCALCSRKNESTVGVHYCIRYTENSSEWFCPLRHRVIGMYCDARGGEKYGIWLCVMITGLLLLTVTLLVKNSKTHRALE